MVPGCLRFLEAALIRQVGIRRQRGYSFGVIQTQEAFRRTCDHGHRVHAPIVAPQAFPLSQELRSNSQGTPQAFPLAVLDDADVADDVVDLFVGEDVSEGRHLADAVADPLLVELVWLASNT